MDELEYVEYKVNNGETESCWADNKNERIQTNSCEWIRVEDGLPEDEDMKWVVCVGEYFDGEKWKETKNAYYMDGWWCNEYHEIMYNQPTHWQEIVYPEEE